MELSWSFIDSPLTGEKKQKQPAGFWPESCPGDQKSFLWSANGD